MLELDIESRRKIYQAILNNPGIHFRELSRIINMQVGVLVYNLEVLEKGEMIIAKQDGKYKRYYAATTQSPQERNVLGVLRQNIPRTILIHLLESGGLPHSKLAGKVNISGSTLSYYLKKLEEAHIIGTKKEEKNMQFYVVDQELVANTLIKYRKTFIDKLVDSFVEVWLKN